MTTIATLAPAAADSWTISIGGGWIVLMLIGMGVCFVGMLSVMWLMRGGHGRPMCGRGWTQQAILTGTPGPGRDRTTGSPASET